MAKGVKKLPSGKIKYRGQTFDGYNKPKRSPKKDKKGVVLAKEGDKVKMLHFGDASMGHNYSPEARKNFKSRHAKNIAKGKMSAAYWADKVLWNAKGTKNDSIADKKRPPKKR